MAAMTKRRSIRASSAHQLDPDGRPYGPEGGIISMMSEFELYDHVDMLLEKLQHRDAERRQKAAVAMASFIGDQRYLPKKKLNVHPAEVLATSIHRKKQSKLVIVDCIRALAIMGPHGALPSASEALAKMTAHTEPECRYEAVRALRHLGPTAAPGCSAALGAVVTDVHELGEPLLRLEGALALEVMGPAAAEDAAEALATALEDEDADVRVAVANALKAMGKSAAKASAKALVKQLEKGTCEMRHRCLDALEVMGESAAEDAAKAVGKLLTYTPWSDDYLRQRAAETLQAFGKDSVRQYARQLELAKALGDPDANVRSAAQATLQDAGCKTALLGSMALFDRCEIDAPKELEPPRPPSESSSEEEEEEDEVEVERPEAPEERSEVLKPEAKEPEEVAEVAADPPEEKPATPERPKTPEDSTPVKRKSSTTFGAMLAEAKTKQSDKEKADKIKAESEKVMSRIGAS